MPPTDANGTDRMTERKRVSAFLRESFGIAEGMTQIGRFYLDETRAGFRDEVGCVPLEIGSAAAAAVAAFSVK